MEHKDISDKISLKSEPRSNMNDIDTILDDIYLEEVEDNSDENSDENDSRECNENIHFSEDDNEYNNNSGNHWVVNPVDSLTSKTAIEFNEAFDEYNKMKSDLSIDKLNRCLAILASSINPSELNPDILEIANLFRNLYLLMNTVDSRSALLYSSISLLEIASQNPRTRCLLVNKYKFVQALSKIVPSVSNQEITLSMLQLLENITYEISLSWQEPYLENLIKFLVNYLYTRQGKVKSTALSVLINLCYKNLPAKYVLLRAISVEEFLNEIENFGILACKMNFILENYLENVSKEEIHKFIKFTFEEIRKSLRNFNSGLLRHTIDFFLDMKVNKSISSNFMDYPSFPEDVEELVETIESCTKSMDTDSPVKDASYDYWPLCISVLLDFLEDLIKTNGHQLQSCVPKLINNILNWIYSDKAGAKSLQLLCIILQQCDDLNFIRNSLEDFVKNISRTLIILRSIKMNQEQISSLLKLLIELLKLGPPDLEFRNCIEGLLTERVFTDFLNNDFSLTDNIKIELRGKFTIPRIYSCIQGLFIIHQLSKYYPECDYLLATLQDLLESPYFHMIIAKGMFLADSGIVALILSLAKEAFFPIEEISKKIVKQRIFLINQTDKTTKSTCNSTASAAAAATTDDDECRTHTCENYLLMNINFEKRLNKLTDKMFEAHKETKINNILVADVMDLFELKMGMCLSKEKELLERIDECTNEITNLSQNSALLSAKIHEVENENVSLQMNMKRYKDEIKILEEINSNFLKSMKEQEEQIGICKENENELLSKLQGKEDELKEIKKDYDAKISSIDSQKSLREEYENEIFAKNQQIASVQEELVIVKVKCNEYERRIEEKENQISILERDIDVLGKTNAALRENLQNMQKLLTAKENILTKYAKDLHDIEEMRNRVLNIIQKRKNQ